MVPDLSPILQVIFFYYVEIKCCGDCLALALVLFILYFYVFLFVFFNAHFSHSV